MEKYASQAFSAAKTRVAVIGAGVGGHSFTSQLIKSGKVSANEITLLDPSTEHHYQSAYTMVGGGLLGSTL